MSYAATADLYDLVYGRKDYAAEAARIRELVAERHPAARSLLDVACGTGRHLEHLARWYTAEGVDAEPGLLEHARRRLPDVPLHIGDMREFDLGRKFDVVTCLFSSIGYMLTEEDLRRAVRTMADHVAERGVLVVEPWLSPDDLDPADVRIATAEGADLKVVRMNAVRLEGHLSIFEFHYLVGRPGSVDHVVDVHALGLYREETYRAALAEARLATEHDPEGLIGRGLWIATRGTDASAPNV